MKWHLQWKSNASESHFLSESIYGSQFVCCVISRAIKRVKVERWRLIHLDCTAVKNCALNSYLIKINPKDGANVTRSVVSTFFFLYVLLLITPLFLYHLSLRVSCRTAAALHSTEQPFRTISWFDCAWRSVAKRGRSAGFGVLTHKKGSSSD